SRVPTCRGLLEPVGHRHGQDAPARVDALLCPALAVDRQGMRLGRGAGCYDRALAHKGPHTPAIALVYDDEFVDELPRDPHDVPVDAVATPGDGVHAFLPSSPVGPVWGAVSPLPGMKPQVMGVVIGDSAPGDRWLVAVAHPRQTRSRSVGVTAAPDGHDDMAGNR